jgi:hypothetical protein
LLDFGVKTIVINRGAQKISEKPVYQEKPKFFPFFCIKKPALTFTTLNLANSNFPNFDLLADGNSNLSNSNFAQKYNSNFNFNYLEIPELNSSFVWL